MAKLPKWSVQITKKDLGLGHILEEVAKLRKKPYVKIGVQGRSALAVKQVRDEDGKITGSKMNVVDVAAVHEFGSPARHIPERSFIRSTIRENRANYVLLAREELDKILTLKGYTTEKALGILGLAIQNGIKARFTNNDWPMLSLRTMKARMERTGGRPANKKFINIHRPLLDTGQLRNSITFVRVMDGKE